MIENGEILDSTSSRAALETRLVAHEERIRDRLVQFEPISAIAWWLDIIRSAEELINLPLVEFEDADFERFLFFTPLSTFLQHPMNIVRIRKRLAAQLSETCANRVSNLITFGFAMGVGFAQAGLLDIAAGYRTLGTMAGYFQSRRRHMVGLLHLMSQVCKGREVITQNDALNVLMPIIEMDGVQMMGAQNALIIKLSRQALGLPMDSASDLHMLDSMYLEPERARITDMAMTTVGEALLTDRENQPADKLFSAAELRNDIRLIRSAYAEFNLAETDFEAGATLVEVLSRRYVDRDFWIKITPGQLWALFEELRSPKTLQTMLINKSDSYMGCLSTYSPFILMNRTYQSTVSLLSRFIYYWRGHTLEHRKRFQIRAGFIFEDAVAEAVQEQGFAVQNITRVNRSEFDVVTIRDGVIWNVQCKNNFVDLNSVEINPVRFARYNRLCVRSYERAIAKELGREELLKTRLGHSVIQHVVLSKFPVITDNPRILPFSQVRDFTNRANLILASDC